MNYCCLVKRDSKGKIRVVATYYKNNDGIYTIYRETGQYGGKITNQPDIVVSDGKVKRTPAEQCQLQFDAIVKKYTDKGYKALTKDINEYSISELESLIPEHTTDANGIRKPMLAKQSEKVKQSSIDRLDYWYASRKINGCRCMIYWDGKKVHTASRGGGDYDPAMKFLIENPKLVSWFKNNPDIVLDGECYKAFFSLQKISGAARLEQDTEGMDWLEYYIYDVAIPDVIFEDRLKILERIKSELNLGFDPYKEWKDNDLRFQMVPQVKVTGWDNIQKLHNKWVSEGWEGLVIRDPNKYYKFGGRGNEMIKVKHYLDSSDIVIGYELGLRGSEDMAFIMQMKDGRTFKASPLGDRATKQEYVDNFESKYKNQIGDFKYFEMTDDNLPAQPKFLQFRYDLKPGECL